MRRRALLGSLATTSAVGLAGCAILGPDREVGDGDPVDLADGTVSLGWLGFQSSFVDDTTAPATAYGTDDQGFVVLDCDCRAYDAPIDALPFAVEFDDERVSGRSDFLVSGAGDEMPRLAFPVPTGQAIDAGAIVFEDAAGRDRRYPFPARVREKLAAPATWRVDVDSPDAIAAPGSARAWATATNTGDTAGRLDAVLTHDGAAELYWTHDFDAPAGDDETYGYRFHCLCGDADELAVTIDWGFDAWTGKVPVDP